VMSRSTEAWPCTSLFLIPTISRQGISEGSPRVSPEIFDAASPTTSMKRSSPAGVVEHVPEEDVVLRRPHRAARPRERLAPGSAG
jgi:hypothetical protein